MTGVAPEPADRAVARILAGGFDDASARIAADLAMILNRATRAGVRVTPRTDSALDDPVYEVEGTSGHAVTWDRATRTWNASSH